MEYKPETSDEMINKYLDDPNSIIQGGLFNANDFNKAYEVMKEHKKTITQEYDITYLNQLNQKENENIKHKEIYNQSIYEIMINLKNTINDIFSDIFHFQFTNIFVKDGRLFYIGLIFIIIGLLLYLFHLLFNKDETISIKKEE